ncbi:MAG: 3-phosphoshikimate 1-carboxyvinyltransferase [Burkholderiales bacterium]|nr:3-phosphoshikimate 1-carboxyvinyltransferase [Phycisphaerae bacterium]
MQSIQIEPLKTPFDMDFAPPGSKSLTNRAMVLAALSEGTCTLSGALLADDTRVMIEGLRKLGFSVIVDESASSITITGQNGRIIPSGAELSCGNSGTTIRFLTALCCLGRGEFVLDGVPRMRQRPIGPLVTMLRNMGARIEHLGDDGFPPVRVLADRFAGGIVRYGSETSSQFLTAVLQIAPFARNEVIIDLVGRQTSWPYVAMTMQLMDRFHHICELERDPSTAEPIRIVVPRGTYRCDHFAVEPDASNATYSLALAALHPGAKVTITGLGKRSLQGDVDFANVLQQMGARLTMGPEFITITGPAQLEGIDVDLSGMPDTAQTLAVVAVFADGPTTIRGLHTLRVKETDRLAALEAELTKLGAEIQIEDDALTIHPPEKLKPAAINTYDDHRMAMSFALAGTKSSGIRINDPDCVNKTYPTYFNDLRRFGVDWG